MNYSLKLKIKKKEGNCYKGKDIAKSTPKTVQQLLIASHTC